MSNFKVGLASGTAAIALTVMGNGALAQSADDANAASQKASDAAARMSTIIVTARKRDEQLKDVPTAISAFGEEEISRLNLRDIDDLASFTPGLLTSEGAASSGGSISLRGIGSGSTNYLADQAVSINVDGMQVGSFNIRRTAQIDLAQIEVLRGPQALFFGKNSPGGVISMKTADPGDQRELELEAGYEVESQDTYVQALYSTPLSDRLGFRIVARHTDLNGYFNIKSLPSAGDPLVSPAPVSTWPKGEEFFARATLVAEPTDRLTVRGKISYNESDIQGGSLTAGQRIDCPLGAPQLQPDFPCVADRDIYAGGGRAGDTLIFPGASDPSAFGFRENEQVLATVQADYEFSPGLTGTSVTGFYTYDETNAHDASIGPRAVLPLPFLPFQLKQFTQELRLSSDWSSPVNFTVGAFFESKDTFGSGGAVVTFLPPAPFPIGPEATTEDQQAFSIFGQLLWDVTDRLEVSAGARYSEEEKDLRFEFAGADVTANLAKNSLSFDNISPELTVSYDLTHNIMVFGSYKEGFKSGGFDAGFTNAVILQGNFANTYDEEVVSGFEGGMKATLWDNLALNVTAYDYDYEDLQVGAFDPDSISFKVLNAAAASVSGVEADFIWEAPVDGLVFRGSLALNNAEFDEFLSGCYLGQTIALGCDVNFNAASGAFLQQDMAGRQLNGAPETAATAGVSYETQFQNGLGLQLSLDGAYSSEYSANLRQSPQDLQEDYTKLNGAIRIFGRDDRWEFALIGRNLTDEYTFNASGPITFTGGGSGTTTAALGDRSAFVSNGREVFLQLTFRPFN